jgi:diguanylate cyclase (GGDEF)-like protein
VASTIRQPGNGRSDAELQPPEPGAGGRIRAWLTAGGAALALTAAAGFGLARIPPGPHRLLGLLVLGALAAGAVAAVYWSFRRLVVKPLEEAAAWAAGEDSSPVPPESLRMGELATLADAVAALRRRTADAEAEVRSVRAQSAAETDRLQRAMHREREAAQTLSEIASAIRDQTNAVLEAMEEGIVVLDDHNEVMLMNDSAMAILEAEASWIGRNIGDCPHAFSDLANYLWKDESDDAEWQTNLVAEGRVVVASGKPVRSGAAGARLLVLRDITVQTQMEIEIVDRNRELQDAQLELERRNEELKEANSRLEELSVTDALTGLPNTRKMHEALATAIERHRRRREGVAFLMLDIDHFKEYNDSFGHPAGDRVLQNVAAVLRESVRTLDLPARYGGEEFVVVLPDCDEESAVAVAERIRQAIEGHKFEHRVITVSVGVGMMTDDAVSQTGLIARADEALYDAKRGGRNRVSVWRACMKAEPDEAA